jgi:hypothetical protein
MANAKVVAGLSHVLATSKKWGPTQDDVDFQKELVEIIKEICNGVIAVDHDTSGLLRSSLKDKLSLGDVGGTALMAASVFRMAILEPEIFGRKYLTWAEKKSQAVFEHFDFVSGIASSLPTPFKESQQEPLVTGSSDTQSYVILLFAARRDYSQSSSQERLS